MSIRNARRTTRRRTAPQAHQLPSGRASNHLLIDVSGGDERAFEQFYDCVAGMILSTARVILGDRARAEEVTEDILVQLWDTTDRRSPDQGDAAAWAMTLAHHHLVECLRSALPGTPTAARTPPHVERRFDPVADVLAPSEDCRRLHRALGQLTAVQRDAVMLAYYRGLTCAEIARELNVPPATVPTRLHEALLHLGDRRSVIP